MKLELQLPMSLEAIAAKIGAELSDSTGAAAHCMINNIAALDTALEGSISFLANPIYSKFLPTTKASAVVVSAKDAIGCPVPALVVKNPRLALGRLLQLCESQKKVTHASGVHLTAILGVNVKLGENVTIGPYCVVGDNCEIGANSILKSNVNVYANTKIGEHCTIHSGTVLGSDGFGYEIDEVGNWLKMPHLGGLVIGNHVEIGSNTSIDRGMIDNTVIGDWVIIDNLVQIGHNVRIGDHTAIAGCVGVAGSTSIGRYCLIGGASCITGHIVITDKVHISGATAVSHSILQPGIYSSGLPARENNAWRRSVARFNTLDDMAKKIKALEKAWLNTDE